MSLHCPECGLPILGSEITPAGDLAYCRPCELTSAVVDCQSALARSQRPAVPPEPPPAGIQWEESLTSFRVSISKRSWAALFFWPFLLLWGGGSLGGFYGSQIMAGQFSWLKSLFGLPFLAGTTFLLGLAFMLTFGREIIEVTPAGMLRIRRGGLGIYWTKAVPWLDVVSAEIEEKTRRTKRGYTVTYSCVLQQRQGKPLVVGSSADRTRAGWLVRTLATRIYLRR